MYNVFTIQKTKMSIAMCINSIHMLHHEPYLSMQKQIECHSYVESLTINAQNNIFFEIA